MKTKLAIILCGATVLMGMQARKTVWNGIYSEAQATRGLAVYEENCARCHGAPGGQTPALVGNDFMDRWREDNLESLYLFVKNSMPPTRGRTVRTPLADNLYQDVLAFILKSNFFPAGTSDLRPESFANVQIEGKDGPKPVPNSAFIQTVGCMTQLTASTWGLTMATEPRRSRANAGATMDELKEAASLPVGSLTFRLQNVDFLGAEYNPANHVGHRMQAKGIIIRQPNAERIDVRSLAMVSDTCPK